MKHALIISLALAGNLAAEGVADLKVNPNTGEIVGQANFWTGNAAGIGSALSATFQPLDADLTAIAALSTATYGRSLLVQADAAAARTTLGLGDSATRNVGTGAGNVAAADDFRITQYYATASQAQGIAGDGDTTAWPASWTGEPFGAATVVVGEPPMVEGVQTIGVHPWSARLWDISMLTGISKVYALGSSGEPENWALGPTLAVTSGTLGVVASSTSAPGVVQLATDTEIQTGTDTGKAVRVSGLAAFWTWVKTQAQTVVGWTGSNTTLTGSTTISGTATAAVVTATTATVNTGTVGALRVTGVGQFDGNVTLGDAGGDALTINAGTITAPNQSAASASSVMTRQFVPMESQYYYTRSPHPSDFTYATTGTGSGAAADSNNGTVRLNIGIGSAIGQYSRAQIATGVGNGGGANSPVNRPITLSFGYGIPTPQGTSMKLIAAYGADTSTGVLTAKGFSAEIFPNQSNDLILSVHNGTTLFSGTLASSLVFYTESGRLVLAWDGVSTLSAYGVPANVGGRAALLGTVTATTAPTGNWNNNSMYFYNFATGTANTSDNVRIHDVTYRIY